MPQTFTFNENKINNFTNTETGATTFNANNQNNSVENNVCGSGRSGCNEGLISLMGKLTDNDQYNSFLKQLSGLTAENRYFYIDSDKSLVCCGESKFDKEDFESMIFDLKSSTENVNECRQIAYSLQNYVDHSLEVNSMVGGISLIDDISDNDHSSSYYNDDFIKTDDNTDYFDDIDGSDDNSDHHTPPVRRGRSLRSRYTKRRRSRKRRKAPRFDRNHNRSKSRDYDRYKSSKVSNSRRKRLNYKHK